jgi:Fe-S cluster assembly ATP-binding protein
MNNNILTINNLDVSIGNKNILKNFNLTINLNEIHLLMGPNGSGKSTLSKILAGHPFYNINSGEIIFQNNSLLPISPELRSHLGIFLAFQSPLEIPGISTYDFLRVLYNQKLKYTNQNELDPLEFFSILKIFIKKLQIPEELLYRNFNEGFSGGEKKRLEVLQMLLLKPKLIILDEIDSGLDMDAIKIIYQNIIKFKEDKASILLISHNPNILEYIKPDYIHILKNGKIIQTGKDDLVLKIFKNGYNSI